MSVAMFCPKCGRYEPETPAACQCGRRGTRCSRYEWFLADALRKLAPQAKVTEQYPVTDHRGFTWRWDIAVQMGHHLLLIDVDGAEHGKQKKYTGPGGGYTRDFDKQWETQNSLRGSDRRILRVNNLDAKLRNAEATARAILAGTYKRSKEAAGGGSV